MRAAVSITVACLALGASEASAQTRRARRPGCTLTHTTLAQVEGDAIDPSVAPALVFVGDGAVAAWRERSGSLRVATFDESWRVVGAAREVARPVGAWSLARTTNGAALVYVERDHELVLARINARGEAQNVPRRIAREDAVIDGVAATRTDVGMLVAWSAAGGRTLRGTAVDVRGVPRGATAEMGEGRAPRFAWLPSMMTAALSVTGPATDETQVLGVSPSAQVNTRLRWPAATLGPFDVGASLYAVQVHGAGDPVLVRVPPEGTAFGAPSDATARPRYGLVDAAVGGAGVVTVLRDLDGARDLVTRVTSDEDAPTPAVLRVGAPEPATLAARGDGVVFVLHRVAGPHGSARVVASQVACGRALNP